MGYHRRERAGIAGFGHGGPLTVVCKYAVAIYLTVIAQWCIQDMARFSSLCTRHNSLTQLRSITLTIDNSPTWYTYVLELLHPTRLEQFHVSTVGGNASPAVDEEFCSAIVDRHRTRLQRFSVHRLRVSLASVDYICRWCERLEQLFVVAEQGSLVPLCTSRVLALC